MSGHPRPATSDTAKAGQAYRPTASTESQLAVGRGAFTSRRTSPTSRIQTASLPAVVHCARIRGARGRLPLAEGSFVERHAGARRRRRIPLGARPRDPSVVTEKPNDRGLRTARRARPSSRRVADQGQPERRLGRDGWRPGHVSHRRCSETCSGRRSRPAPWRRDGSSAVATVAGPGPPSGLLSNARHW
jgi:hypothetical protein